jgi:hypothetical protein
LTPEALQVIGSILDRYGLPIALLIGLGWLLLTGRLVLGSDATYREDRRREERAARLDAEAALRAQTEALRELTDAVADLAAAKDPPRVRRQ